LGHNWGMKIFAFIVLGLVIAASGGGVFAEEAATATSAPAAQESGVTLTSPKEWEIFQRTSPTEGRLRIEGRVGGLQGRPLHLLMSVKPGESSGVPSSTRIADMADVTSGKDGTFEVEMKVPAGGWHVLLVAVSEMDRNLGQAVVEHVGVGEVFVVGGQSNSTNWGEARTRTDTGMVTVFDGKEWTVAADPIPGVDAGQGKGSPWCLFGDDMYAKLHVPIGIVPVGKGSTSVRQWLPKGDVVEIEPTRTDGLKKNPDGKWVNDGTLYDRMVERMKQLDEANGGGHGFRAMLWHQGESDAHQPEGHTLPGKDYRAMLERVIKESRKEVGWEVPWFVATATWGSPESPIDPDIRAAQHGVVEDGVAMQGPDTDTLIGANRQKHGTGVHMSLKGLYAHAGLWANIVGPWVTVQQGIQNK